MKEELVTGIRNAIERGDSMNKAIASFVNAGYNPIEVDEAAKIVSGASPLPRYKIPNDIANIPLPQNQQILQPMQSAQEAQPKPKQAGKGMILTIIILLLIVLGLFGYISYKYFLT